MWAHFCHPEVSWGSPAVRGCSRAWPQAAYPLSLCFCFFLDFHISGLIQLSGIFLFLPILFNMMFFFFFSSLFLAALGRLCCVWAFSSYSKCRLLSSCGAWASVVHGLLIAVTSLIVERGLKV